MFKCNFFMVVDLQGSWDRRKKIEAKEKLPVEKWPQIFNRRNRFGLVIRQRLQTISCFWYFLLYFFSVLRGPFNAFSEESETIIPKQFCLKFHFCFGL